MHTHMMVTGTYEEATSSYIRRQSLEMLQCGRREHAGSLRTSKGGQKDSTQKQMVTVCTAGTPTPEGKSFSTMRHTSRSETRNILKWGPYGTLGMASHQYKNKRDSIPQHKQNQFHRCRQSAASSCTGLIDNKSVYMPGPINAAFSCGCECRP